MKEQRWLRIIPVALIMYTISYVDRTNVSLALDPEKSSMLRDLGMNSQMKGLATGVFFFGYLLMQIPGGYLARNWSARKFISCCLVVWGIFAVACGMTRTFTQFTIMRFFLGVAESGVYPATLVLLYHWFPRAERARATAYWNLCQPIAVACSAPITMSLINRFHWNGMILMEGALPFIWLPLWWFLIRDHPREAKWISPEEREHLESTLAREDASLAPSATTSVAACFNQSALYVMIGLYFLHNCAAYGCMTFLSETFKGNKFTSLQYGWLFAFPYAVTAVVMVLLSRHSDKKQERRMHVAFIYAMSGISLILSVLCRGNFWVSYAFMCLAIPGPFSGMAPFWAHAGETLPANIRGSIMGLVNAVGNVGGFVGPYFIGWMSDHNNGDNSTAFIVIGLGMLGCTTLAFFLPKAAPVEITNQIQNPAAADKSP